MKQGKRDYFIKYYEKIIANNFRSYELKNSAGMRTKGKPRKTSSVLMGLQRKYTLNEAILTFCLYQKEDMEELKRLHGNIFINEDPTRITVWIDPIEKWGEIIFGESIKDRIAEDILMDILRKFKKDLNRNLILPGCQNLLISLQKSLGVNI